MEGAVIFDSIAFIIEHYIVERRELVIRHGRQLQRYLRLPDCLCIFAETDPGMLDDDIRLASMLLAIASFSSILGLLAGIAEGTISHAVLIAGIVLPTCLIILLWLLLCLSRRRLVSSRVSLLDDSNEEERMTASRKGQGSGGRGQGQDDGRRNRIMETSLEQPIEWNWTL